LGFSHLVEIFPHVLELAGFKKNGNIFILIKKKSGQNLKKNKIMRNILYIIAVILIIGWLLGVFVYSLSGLIHILIILAIISLLLGLINRGGADV
jgi:membrane protein insertase Oxa1/YidC/SpoIIIJ